MMPPLIQVGTSRDGLALGTRTPRYSRDMVIRWDPALVMGVPEIDRQHKEIFLRLDALLQAIRGGSSREEVGRTLAFLREHVATHFKAEEALMREAAFPGTATHRVEHERFASDLDLLAKEHSRDGASPSLVLRVSGRVSEWLREHIHRADRELAGYLRARPPL
jgi:hemerythrin